MMSFNKNVYINASENKKRETYETKCFKDVFTFTDFHSLVC